MLSVFPKHELLPVDSFEFEFYCKSLRVTMIPNSELLRNLHHIKHTYSTFQYSVSYRLLWLHGSCYGYMKSLMMEC